MHPERDHWWHTSACRNSPPPARPSQWPPRTRCSSSTPSGSTGTPKGVLHTTAGYLLWANLTFETVFDYQTRARSSGAPPTSAGSPGTAISSMARFQRRRLGADVRRCADPGPPCRPLLGGTIAQATRSTSSTPRPTASAGGDARWRCAGGTAMTCRRCDCWARWGSRSTPKPGAGITALSARVQTADRRYLVADRNRRRTDHAAAGRHGD